MKANDQTKEFREMSELELREKYQELTKELFNLRFQGATIQLSSPARFKHVRRDIARLKTVATERQIKIG